MKNTQEAINNLTRSGAFMEALSGISDLGFHALMDRASTHWDQINTTLRRANVDLYPIGPMAASAGLPWPTTRANEFLDHYLKFPCPTHLLRLQGYGKQKIRTILLLVLGLADHFDNDGLNAVETGNDHSQMAIVIPSDPIARVELFWSRLSEKISTSPISETRFSHLARQWGVAWPNHSRVEYTLGDAVEKNSLSEFVTKSRGLGKRKKPSIAAILWRAWTEVEPDGPAGPPESGNEAARNEFDTFAEDADLLAIIQKAIDLAKLSKRERSILERRYGLLSGMPMTLEEIGQADQVIRSFWSSSSRCTKKTKSGQS